MSPIDTTRKAAPMTVDSISPDRAALYRLGGVAAVLLGASYLVVTILYSLAGAAPTGSQAYLEYLAQRTANWWGITGFSVLTDFLFFPVALALYLALKGIDKNAAIVGSGLLAMFAILDLAVTWPNYASLIVLSGDYAAATTDVQRASFIAAASYPSSVLESPLFPVYVILVPAMGIAIVWHRNAARNVQPSSRVAGCADWCLRDHRGCRPVVRECARRHGDRHGRTDHGLGIRRRLRAAHARPTLARRSQRLRRGRSVPHIYGRRRLAGADG
jgi:hypothetical protein